MMARLRCRQQKPSQDHNVLGCHRQCSAVILCDVQTEPAPPLAALGGIDRGRRGRSSHDPAEGAAPRRRWPVAPIAGFVTLAAVLLGALLTVLAVTIGPDPTSPITSDAERPRSAATSPDTSRGQDDPAGAPTPGTATDRVLDQLTRRIEQRLGESNRGVEHRVTTTVTGGVLDITWALNQPQPDDTTRGSASTPRIIELREELRDVLRALAIGGVPDQITGVRLRATHDGQNITQSDAGEDTIGPTEAVVLDAWLPLETLSSLEPDDVRLDDATLAELLGLADFVSGAPAWGVPTT